jgi:glycosyltransferase involved in cell wall biosynthesis
MIPHDPEDLDHPSLTALPVSPYLAGSGDLYGPKLSDEVENFTRRVAARAEAMDFDLIHAHDWMTARAGLEIKARRNKPLIFHVHSLSYDRSGPAEQGGIAQLERSTMQEADLVVTVSDYTRDICLTQYGADPEKTIVVHNGSRPIKAYRSRRPFPEKLVVFLGRLAAQKNPGHFLEIANRVLARRIDVRFAMAGAGDQLRSLMSHSVRLGIADKFHFTGFLNRRKVHHLFSMADVYCMPSASEPFGLAALEAAQFGVPIVISDRSGVSEVLQNVKTASPGELDAFADHIIDLLEQDQPPHPIATRSWDKVAEKLLQHYEELTLARSAPNLA